MCGQGSKGKGRGRILKGSGKNNCDNVTLGQSSCNRQNDYGRKKKEEQKCLNSSERKGKDKSSISDEDIRRRDPVFKKEAEEIWEMSKKLGLHILREKEKVIKRSWSLKRQTQMGG
ncbi:Uncharacterized protein TCM_026163 [Theobroma cacao]|uniref:Uncharacterized protein n=1 Tax=Theobroma cacao TaxID=3641 RepID=A0A061F1T2_THECC|nr:Uncharacterized protein TCM_026163 [Theobroma cacao]